jgi:hypothetical protein
MSDMSDLSATIVAKSDQLNADDLLTGPITITVMEVRGGSADQPVIIHYDGDNGHPFKPCKTMRRVLVAAWGKNGHAWKGRSMTLYNEPSVKFGGVEVGGIRISHLSHIDSDMVFSLNATKGKKAPYKVKRMQDAQRQSAPAQQGSGDSLTLVTAEQVENMTNALEERGVDPKALCDAAANYLGLPIQRLDQIPASFYGKACGWIAKQNPAPPSDFE